MIVDSTLGSAVLDTSQPFGIPYHGWINLPDDLSTATFELPNGEQRPYQPGSQQYAVWLWNSTRYGHGTQVFKIRDGAPQQTAAQRAAGQRFTDYAIIHSFGGSDGTSALIGGAVVANGSYVYHSPISGNWLVGVRGMVVNNVATVQITLTPFGVIGEDARQPITRTLTLQDAGQNDADSKPILRSHDPWVYNTVHFAQSRFGVALHTASHDGGHASLVVWTDYTGYRSFGSIVSDWNWKRNFPVGWLALELSDPQDATALAPPDALLSVQFDRVQTMGVRFTDDYTGCTLHDQSYMSWSGDSSWATRPTTHAVTDGIQEVIKKSAWGPDYDDLHADLTTSYTNDPDRKVDIYKTIQGYDKRIVSLWYAPGESKPTPVKLTHYKAIARSYDDSVDVQGSGHEEWTETWQYDAQGVPVGVYLDYEKTLNVSGGVIWRNLTKTSTRVAVMLGDEIILERDKKSTQAEVLTFDYTTNKQVSYHGEEKTAPFIPSFIQLPIYYSGYDRGPTTKEYKTTVDSDEMDVGNFSPEFNLSAIEYDAGQDYILPHLMDIGNEPLTVALVVDDQPKLLLWPDMRMVDPQTDPRSSGGVSGTYALSAPLLLQCATHPIQDDPANQVPRVYLSYRSANLGSAPHEQKVNLICI